MGLTGSGKSTFASLLTGQRVTVGHGLASNTAETSCYTIPLDSGETFRLIDTPGFDDTAVSDEAILKKIAAELASHNDLLGIIYLHRITDVRLSGASIRGFNVLKKLCQPENYDKIVLATTMWSDAELAIGGKEAAERRESQLWEFHWSKLFYGSKIVRHHNTEDSARRIVGLFLDNRSILLPSEAPEATMHNDTVHDDPELLAMREELFSVRAHEPEAIAEALDIPNTTDEAFNPWITAWSKEPQSVNDDETTQNGHKQPADLTLPPREPDRLYHPSGRTLTDKWETDSAGWPTDDDKESARRWVGAPSDRDTNPDMEKPQEHEDITQDARVADNSMQLVKRMSWRPRRQSERGSSTATAQFVGFSTVVVFFTGIAYKVTTFFGSDRSVSNGDLGY
ncbi:hypothetical protein QBC47DRAFT_400833 [Echria macrotheca]|uniref:G domain-containing protein n=1 Tax=Echria macrotheca TaxID=438768 RepID=A0AAJ0BHC1_9PEZI|nr:hypothetical protein QBC47DRAFT_400833 [Echria macrotheca]